MTLVAERLIEIDFPHSLLTSHDSKSHWSGNEKQES